MPGRYYTARADRGDREGFSITFRHPLLNERGTQRMGRKVRRGLATRDETEANRLVDEMNALLSDETLWDLKAKPIAEQRFSQRIVEIFYSDLIPETHTAEELRENLIPLPTRDDGYRRILLLGTTGSGKTTLVRQMLGTSPYSERFPSTSTARTTVADTEVVFSDGPFRAVATFVPRNQVRDFVEESLQAAAIEAINEGSDAEILRVFLSSNSRFRLSYILGQSFSVEEDDEDEDDADTEFDDDVIEDAVSEADFQEEELDGTTDVASLESETSRCLLDVVASVRELASQARERATTDLPIDGPILGSLEYERMREDRVQEALDLLLRETDSPFDAVEKVMQLIESRIKLVTVGYLDKTRQGWPRSWFWHTEDRREFFRVLRRFSGNAAKFFGQLLTPIVNGLRVAGPFQPDWALSTPKLVLYDIEGLGHTADSASSLPARVTKRLDDVDALVLVDNATQSMQAGPIAILKSVGAAGKTARLVFCFTHFDLVTGDNLRTFSARRDHVVASVEGVLTKLRDTAGPFTVQSLRQRLKEACFVVGDMDRILKPKRREHNRYRLALAELVEHLERLGDEAVIVTAKPHYDRGPLTLGVGEALEQFHKSWRERLGLSVGDKRHWTQIKALSRRFAEQTDDEYGDLRPVADLHLTLSQVVSRFVQEPLKWTGEEPSDSQKQAYFSHLMSMVNSRLGTLLAEKIAIESLPAWKKSYYDCSGYGSTISRAEIIVNEILGRTAPIPTFMAASERNTLMRDIQRILNEALDTRPSREPVDEPAAATVGADS